YIIRKNFQLGLGIDGCLIADQDIIVLLKGVRFLCDLIHNDLSVKYTCSIFAIDPFIILMAFTIGLDMVHQGMVVHMLFFPYDRYAPHGGVYTLPILIIIQVITGQFPT